MDNIKNNVCLIKIDKNMIYPVPEAHLVQIVVQMSYRFYMRSFHLHMIGFL